MDSFFPVTGYQRFDILRCCLRVSTRVIVIVDQSWSRKIVANRNVKNCYEIADAPSEQEKKTAIRKERKKMLQIAVQEGK